MKFIVQVDDADMAHAMERTFRDAENSEERIIRWAIMEAIHPIHPVEVRVKQSNDA